MNNLWLAFLTGLTTGGLSCLAVQGGLLASAVAPVDGEAQTGGLARRWSLVGLFLLAKLASYTLLGVLLGFVGSSLTLSPKMMGTLQIGVGLYLLATAARLLNLHPIFRYTAITPPRWAYKFLRGQSKTATWFAPAILGFFTVLMPCGVTQAMMALALSTGNPLSGAAIMFAFVLGTSPVFFGLGIAAVEMLEHKAFAVVAAILVFIFGIASINGGVSLRGSIYTLQNFYKAATLTSGQAVLSANSGEIKLNADGKQEVTINIKSNGYTSDTKTLKAGVPVKLKLISNNTQGCSRAFTIPDLGVQKIVEETGVQEIEFTPKKTGRLAYTCSMGMYGDSFNVIP